MAAAPKSRAGLYLGLGALGAGSYYFYRAGGDPKVAKEEVKYDINKARAKAPGTETGERAGERAGLEANLNIDEAANQPVTKNTDLASQAHRKWDDLSQAGKDQAAQAQKKLDDLSQAGKDQAHKLSHEAEQKAAEAKSTMSGWFGRK
ncbi:hypothetical protein BDW74DRAFT_151401 [Aspergillus multicolor]|uniref:uncharacterized protein n=1 Tax=Aspergillus multicolor TaxID=41759 RepID=UPI003CCE38AE